MYIVRNTGGQQRGKTGQFRALLGILIAAGWVVWPAGMSASTTLDAVSNCRKTISKQGASYAKKRRQKLLRCTDKLLKCELAFEVEGVDPSTCRSRARDSCNKALGTDGSINTAIAAFKEKAGTACLLVPSFSDIMTSDPGGLWYVNDATCGISTDLPGLLDCLVGEINEKVDAMVSQTKPRAGILLANIGLRSSYLDITLPPTKNVTVTATNGDIDDPNTISVSSGNSVTFTLDSSLACADKSNSRVTISVGPDCDNPIQQNSVRDPDGDALVFGPFPVNQTYCIDLTGPGCTPNSAFGTLDYGAPQPAPSPAPSADLRACQKKLESGSRSLAIKLARKVGGCADEVEQCQLAGEIDGGDPNSCIATASTKCATLPTVYSEARTKVRAKIATACGLITFSVLRQFVQGLGFENEAQSCDAELIDCVLDDNKCVEEQELLVRDPRAWDSLTTAGIEASFPCVEPEP
jgi:hypothetical protein